MKSLLPLACAIGVSFLVAGCGRSSEKELPEAQAPPQASPEAAAPAVEGKVATELAERSPTAEDAGAAAAPELPVPPASTPSALSPSGKPAEPSDFEGYEAWFERYGLDLKDPKMLDADPDRDGYSNRDEFLVDTDPTDPKSHPGFHALMRLREFKAVEVPIILEKVDGEKATVVNQSNRKTAVVTAGETIPGTSYKVKRVVAQIESDKFGQTTDVSRIMAENTETGELITFVKGMRARSPESYAILTSAEDASVEVKIKQGAEFAWPGQPEHRYLVVDLRPDQVVVKQLDTGEVWTISGEHSKP